MVLHHGFMVKGLTYVIVRLTYIVHHFPRLLSCMQIQCHSSTICHCFIFTIGIS